jgi:hypothetical protein
VRSRSRSYFTTDGQSVSRSVGRSVSMSWCRAPLWGPWPDFTFSFLCRKIASLFVLGRPLWREDGSVTCSAIYQWSESRRTLSHLRLLGSLSVASYGSQGLRWKYSYPHPHRGANNTSPLNFSAKTAQITLFLIITSDEPLIKHHGLATSVVYRVIY